MTPETIAQNLIPTYTVISRHSATCPDKDKGRDYIHCNCRKHVAVYDPRVEDPKKRQSLVPTKTRSWQDAERIAQAYRDTHNPDKRRASEAEAKLQRLQAEKESQTVTIEKAVAMFLASKKAERISPHRIERYLPLIGDVDPEKLTFRTNRRGNTGRLNAWLETLNPRPIYIADLTPVQVEAFRNTWDFDSDLTDYGTFGDLKRFFNYCVGKGWVETHPMAGMRPPKIKRGSRTTAFTDQQYDSILNAIKSRFPAQIKDLEDQKQHDNACRILAFIELMRWGGLALGDAIHFKLDSMNDKGEVTYKRRKTHRRAQPTLLPHVVKLLKTTMPIDGDLNQPFYDKNLDPETNANYWSAEVKEVFKDAGITSVKTDIRDREPHSHMLRDTFAVGQLRTQYKLGQVNHKAVADALGDTVAVMLKHYAPWIEEFEQAHKEAQRRIVDAQAAELAQKQATQDQKLVEIGGRK